MIALDEAQREVRSLLVALAPVRLDVDDALGCVAAAPVVATEPVPRFANSSMDGFALRSEDTRDAPVSLQITGVVLAGAAPGAEVGPGSAMRIMTGAPMPAGADCVEIVEEAVVDASGTLVTVGRRIDRGAFVRAPGEDVSVGDQLIAEGDVVHPTRRGVLATQGISTLMVHPRPCVGVLSTGDELFDGPGAPPPGTIRDVNRHLLLALLAEAGVPSRDLGIVRDDYDDTHQAISRAVETCDVVISTGGVSVGDADFVKMAIAELAGTRARAMKVAVRPGKPFSFGVVGPRAVPVFGLPGNPVSTRVSFELFIRPALSVLAGSAVPPRLMLDAVLDVPMPRQRDGRVHMVHVLAKTAADGRVHVVGAMREGSHLLQAVSAANAIAEVPDGDGIVAGDTVRIIVLHPEELADTSTRADA